MINSLVVVKKRLPIYENKIDLMDLVWEMNDIVERTVEYAFQGKYMFCMYDYLKLNKATKRDVQEFVDGPTARSITDHHL